MPSLSALSTAGTLMPHQNLWCHLPLMDVKLHEPFCSYYLPTQRPKTQTCIAAFNLSGAVKVQSSVQYSSLLPLSQHTQIITTLYLFVVTYRWNPTHISVLNRTVCEVILSQLATASLAIYSALSTDIFQFFTVIEKKTPYPNVHKLVPFQGILYFHVLKIDCCWHWASTVTYVLMKGISQREMSQ